MSDGKNKFGRPFKTDSDPEGEMGKFTFRLDKETTAKLDALASKEDVAVVRGRKAIVIRRLIHEAFEKSK